MCAEYGKMYAIPVYKIESSSLINTYQIMKNKKQLQTKPTSKSWDVKKLSKQESLSVVGGWQFPGRGQPFSSSSNNKGNFITTKKLAAKAVVIKQGQAIKGGRHGGSINPPINNKGNFAVKNKSHK